MLLIDVAASGKTLTVSAAVPFISETSEGKRHLRAHLDHRHYRMRNQRPAKVGHVEMESSPQLQFSRGHLRGLSEDLRYTFEEVRLRFRVSDTSLASSHFSVQFGSDHCHYPSARDIDFNPNRQYYLATGGDDCKIKIWDVRSFKDPLTTAKHSHW